MTLSRTIVGLLLLGACSGEVAPDTPVDETAPEEAPVSREPQQTQAALAEDPNAMRVSGALTCPDDTAAWTVEVYAIPLGDSKRAPDVLPAAAPLTAVSVSDDGAFEMWVPRGARRLFVARSDAGGVAWGDLYGRYTEVVTEVVGLGLDCRVVPVAAPDGSRMATQGERVIVQPEFEPTPETAAELAQNQEWVESVAAGPKVNFWSSAPEDMGGQETVSRIRSRYRSRLTEEELNLMMPMLYQLADRPRESDQLVDSMIRERSVNAARPRDPSLPEVR